MTKSHHATLEYSRNTHNVPLCHQCHHMNASAPLRHLQAWMFHASGIILFMLQVVCYFNLKILFKKKNTVSQWHQTWQCSNTMNEYKRFMLERNKIMSRYAFWYITRSYERSCWELEQNKNEFLFWPQRPRIFRIAQGYLLHSLM